MRKYVRTYVGYGTLENVEIGKIRNDAEMEPRICRGIEKRKRKKKTKTKRKACVDWNRTHEVKHDQQVGGR